MVLIVILVVLVVGLAVYDRRARRRGHTLRSSADMWRSQRDVRRNIRASNSMMDNPIDRQWDTPDDRRHP